MSSLTQFKLDWFNHPQWWFSQTYENDMLITRKYEHLFDAINPNEDPLALILLYDQLPRHIYRYQQANHIIEYYLQQSLTIIYSHIDTIYETNLPSQEWTFFMLPLRHTKQYSNITNVIERTWQRLMNDEGKNISIYKRYLKATYAKLLKDYDNQMPLIDMYHDTKVEDDFSSLLAFNPKSYNDVTTIEDENLLDFQLNLMDTKIPIIVSLSGGVDSMVCAFVLKHYKPQDNLIAIHINYDNRPQCALEVAFLQQWCNHLQIPLYVRTIKEIHRDPCMEYELRDLYESFTRDVRYQSYKSVCVDKPQVILGHNKDDCLENIMTNIAHKNKYDNLKGMSVCIEQDGITFLRPLLETSKENIIKFAESNNIPYLPNSTPVWSQRGQIRNNIVPCVDEWDSRFVPSLFELSDKLSSMYHLLKSSVSLFIDKGTFDRTKTTFIIKALPIKEIVIIDVFWKEFFASAFGYHPSIKSITNLLECIEKYTKTINKETRKIMISKSIVFAMTKNDEETMALKIYKN